MTAEVEGKRKGGGGKLARSETVTVRLDPKLRYLAELAARKQRRTVSSFIEWAVEESLKGVHLDNTTTLADVATNLWDVDEPDRFAKLALAYDYMLTHEEQILWKLICENGYLWRGKYDSNDEWAWTIRSVGLCFDRLREHWETFKAVANGTADRASLPTWPKKKPGNGNFSDFDDEIPF